MRSSVSLRIWRGPPETMVLSRYTKKLRLELPVAKPSLYFQQSISPLRASQFRSATCIRSQKLRGC